MRLGIPGRVVVVAPGAELAQVDVAGVVRGIDLALLEGEFVAGDYVLVHSGFALERMTPDEARDALGIFAEARPAGRDEPRGVTGE
jgi:hydrogenase expression/formation protein HypC